MLLIRFLLRQEPICHLLDGQGSDLLAPLALGLELDACRQTLAFRLQQVVGGDMTQRVVMPRLLFLVIKIEIPATPSILVLDDVAVGGLGNGTLNEHLGHRGVSCPLQGAKTRLLLSER